MSYSFLIISKFAYLGVNLLTGIPCLNEFASIYIRPCCWERNEWWIYIIFKRKLYTDNLWHWEWAFVAYLGLICSHLIQKTLSVQHIFWRNLAIWQYCRVTYLMRPSNMLYWFLRCWQCLLVEIMLFWKRGSFVGGCNPIFANMDNFKESFWHLLFDLVTHLGYLLLKIGCHKNTIIF